MNKTIIIIIVGLVVIIGGYFLFQGGYQAPQEITIQPPVSTPELTVSPVVKDSVSAKDQTQGTSVAIESTELIAAGYVVIHEDKDGKPGPVIGNSSLLEGRDKDVVVELTRSTSVGEVLYAMLHRDDGDGVYEFPGDDAPIKDEKESIVLSKFTIIEKVVEATAPSIKEIAMVSGNFFFSPKNLTLKKDERVKITFQNSKVHTFTIAELGVNVTLQGSSPTVEFTPTKTGTFEYLCVIPGHREGGMLGSLIVE